MRQPITQPILAAGDIAANRQPFARHLKAENLSPKTIYACCGAIEQFEYFLAATGAGAQPGRIADGGCRREFV